MRMKLDPQQDQWWWLNGIGLLHCLCLCACVGDRGSRQTWACSIPVLLMIVWKRVRNIQWSCLLHLFVLRRVEQFVPYHIPVEVNFWESVLSFYHVAPRDCHLTWWQVPLTTESSHWSRTLVHFSIYMLHFIYVSCL